MRPCFSASIAATNSLLTAGPAAAGRLGCAVGAAGFACANATAAIKSAVGSVSKRIFLIAISEPQVKPHYIRLPDFRWHAGFQLNGLKMCSEPRPADSRTRRARFFNGRFFVHDRVL